MNSQPIGIFDSGVGGLTVVKEIIRELPNENIVYIGDTARVPYGTRGKEVITQFATELTNFLLNKDVKCIVVACNTVSATCLSKLQTLSPVPILGVINPAVQTIVDTTKSNKVGIIGTPSTISSCEYEKQIQKLNSKIEVVTKACPLFVPIVEEGLADSDIAKQAAQHYLSDLTNIDTLHLGCTHYPLLTNVIRDVVGNDVTIIDSAKPVAIALKSMLTERKLLNTNRSKPKQSFYMTDVHERTVEVANMFFGGEMSIDIHKAVN